MRVALALLVVLVPAAAAAQPATAPAAAPTTSKASSAPDTGPMIEIRYTPTESAALDDFNFSSPPPAPDPHTALFAGYQLARISFGVGFELGRAGSKNEFQGNSTQGIKASTYLLSPGLRATLGRSQDGRAEVVGIVDIGWGETTFSDFDDFSDDVTYDRFRVQAGPGLRYWPVSSVGFGVAALVRHDRVHFADAQNFNTNEGMRTDLAVSLSATGVF